MEQMRNTSTWGIVSSKLALLVALLLVTAAQADAQYGGNGSSTQNQTSIGIGPQVGLYKAQDADKLKPMYGVAVRLKFGQVLGVEGSINYRQEEYANGAIKVKSWPIMATGLIYVLPVVYGAIGAGWYNSTVDYNIPATPITPVVNVASETTQKFGWHFGGGVEVPLGTAVKLTGDIRYVFLDYKFQQVPGTGDVKSNFYVIGIGLLFGLQ